MGYESIYIEDPDVYPVAITLKVIVWPVTNSYAITAVPAGDPS